MAQADEGISALQAYVDTLIVIPNQNLFRLANERTTFADAFNMADAVLHQGVCGVTDLMIKPGIINLDFADIRSVMTEMGKAMMGTGEGTGENRAIEAAEAAINNPLLDDTTMQGAQALLINITGGMDMTLFEVDEAANRIRREVDEDATIIFGSAFDERLEGIIRVSVVATGFEAAEQTGSLPSSNGKAPAMSNINKVSPIPGLFSAAIPAEQVTEAHNMGRFADKLSPPLEVKESVSEKTELSDTKTPSSTLLENDEHSQASPLTNHKGVEKTDALPEQMNAAEQNLPKASSPELSPLGLMNAQATSTSFSENEANKSPIADEKLGALKVEETENTAQPVFIPEPTEPMSPNASFAPARQKTGLIGRISQMWGASATEGSDSQKSNQSPTANSLGGSTPSLSPLLATRADEVGTSNSVKETPKILDLPTISGGQAAMAFQEVQEQEDPDELDIPAFLRRQAN
jgi:cell division protein FtsZ